jgi:hypothetical protein
MASAAADAEALGGSCEVKTRTDPDNMSERDNQSRGVLSELNPGLFALFRHLLPGAFIVGTAYAAHPSWFASVNAGSWQHLTIGGVVALAAGNIWFSINRYGVHQLIDYFVYVAGSQGPAPEPGRRQYIEDLAVYVSRSLGAGHVAPLARQHVAFRASAVLLLYTVAEICFLFALWNEQGTSFSDHRAMFVAAAVAVFAIGVWQNIITRRIDYHITRGLH